MTMKLMGTIMVLMALRICPHFIQDFVCAGKTNIAMTMIVVEIMSTTTTTVTTTTMKKKMMVNYMFNLEQDGGAYVVHGVHVSKYLVAKPTRVFSGS